MPVENKSLPRIPELGKDYLSDEIDLVAQVRKASYSPSPLVRVLQDPTLLPTKTAEGKKEQRTHHSHSARHREPRSSVVAAIAIAEEERQAKRLKALLRSSGDRLEYEKRRAEEAIARADFAERQEQEALARAKAAERAKENMQIESMRLERDTRHYQLQLEEAQMETTRIHDALEHARREMEELRDAESKAQDMVQSYQKQLHDLEWMVIAATQGIADKRYENGWQDGYDEGYADGREDGERSTS